MPAGRARTPRGSTQPSSSPTASTSLGPRTSCRGGKGFQVGEADDQRSSDMSQPGLPNRFDSVEAVEDFMTAPSDALVAELAGTPGDIIVLGVGGKMGPTLARLAKRAAPSKRVMGVARFSEPGVREALASAGVEPISADLLDRTALEQLPQVANVVFMAGPHVRPPR